MSDAKFRVWRDKKEETKKVLFRLIQENGAVHLVVYDEDGDRLPSGYILQIRKDGRLWRRGSVTSKAGLQLNSSGQIELAN